jgi:hypothetical protein
MSTTTGDSTADFEFSANRRGVVTIWFVSTDDPTAAISTGAAHDRGFGRRFLALYDSTLPVTPIGDFPLNRSAETGDGEYYIGGYEGVAVIQTVLDDASQLSKLPERLRREIAATDVYASVSDKSTGFGAFAHWHEGELKRAFSATRYRTLEDIGLPCPAEGAYWAGKHRPAPVEGADSRPREGVGLPFLPAELADAVIADWLGFDPHSPAADIPVSGFAVDGRRVSASATYPGASRSARIPFESQDGSSSEDDDGRAYDDYEVHSADSSRDFTDEIARFGTKAKNFVSRAWRRARKRLQN